MVPLESASEPISQKRRKDSTIPKEYRWHLRRIYGVSDPKGCNVVSVTPDGDEYKIAQRHDTLAKNWSDVTS